MDEKYINTLKVKEFSRILDDSTECYKFYWLQSIMELTAKGRREFDFDEIINGMILNAWCSVEEYHLQLGLRNGKGETQNSLERAVEKIHNGSGLGNLAQSDEILDFIRKNEKLIHDEKYQISKMVPYRLLSPFLEDVTGNDPLWNQQGRLIEYIAKVDKIEKLPYIIQNGAGLKKRVKIDDLWAEFFLDNFIAIQGWIQLKKAYYLQERNPGVPGIIYKMEPENEKSRKLAKVRELWMAVMEISRVIDIYSKRAVDINNFQMDHFVPWSFIANDEIWNLVPIDGILNAKKNNRLPDWRRYFPAFSENQYLAYSIIYKDEKIMDKFLECRRDNLVSIWANEELYLPNRSKEVFTNILEKNLKPIYDRAKIQGYAVWNI